MRTTTFICCLLFVLLSALVGVAQINVVGKTTRLIPRADLTRAAKTLRPQQNDPVAENDRVRTAAGGRARLELGDGSLVNVGSASELVVHAPAGATQATLPWNCATDASAPGSPNERRRMHSRFAPIPISRTLLWRKGFQGLS